MLLNGPIKVDVRRRKGQFSIKAQGTHSQYNTEVMELWRNAAECTHARRDIHIKIPSSSLMITLRSRLMLPTLRVQA